MSERSRDIYIGDMYNETVWEMSAVLEMYTPLRIALTQHWIGPDEKYKNKVSQEHKYTIYHTETPCSYI